MAGRKAPGKVPVHAVNGPRNRDGRAGTAFLQQWEAFHALVLTLMGVMADRTGLLAHLLVGGKRDGLLFVVALVTKRLPTFDQQDLEVGSMRHVAFQAVALGRRLLPCPLEALVRVNEVAIDWRIEPRRIVAAHLHGSVGS